MKSKFKAALVQFSPYPINETQKNVDYILHKIEDLASKGNELIVFPEMSLTNFFEHSEIGKKEYWEIGAVSVNHEYIKRIVDATANNNVHVIVGIAERSSIIGKIYNSVLLLGPNGLVGITRRLHFPGMEKLYFSPGWEIPVFDTSLGKIGISICYDCMFPEYVRALASKGAEILVFPSSIWKGGEKGGIGSLETKEKFWRNLPAVRALENQAYVIACNGGGEHYLGKQIGTWERMGLSKIVAPTGNVIAGAEGNGEEILEATLLKSILEESRSVYSFLSDRNPSMYEDLVQYHH